MLATVLIEHPDHVIDHYVNDAPTATVEGDFLIGLERGRFDFLSHESSIAETQRNASSICVYYDFFFFFIYLTRKSLSINELRRGDGASFVTR